jgi:SsrA-binding protein
VKALRAGRANIAESYASPERGELFLINAYIPEYAPAAQFNHEPRRPRKLLIHRKELNKLFGAVEREGRTIVPLKLYFNDRGRAKLELALARGKKAHDKREASKERDWKREQGRLLREKG